MQQKKKKGALVLLLVLFFIPISFASKIERGSSWERTCINNTCTQIIYSNNMFILDSDGIYKKLGDVVKVSFNNKMLNISWRDRNILLEPFIIFNEKTINIDDKLIKNNFNISFDKHDDHIKFTPKIKYINGINGVGFKKNLWSNDEIVVDFTDVLKSYFTISENSSHIIIKNLTNKQDVENMIEFDPTIILNNSEIIDDTYMYKYSGTLEYGSAPKLAAGQGSGSYSVYANFPILKINISSLPNNANITYANLSLYLEYNFLDIGESYKLDAHHVYRYPYFNVSGMEWVEGNSTNSGCTASSDSAVPPEISWNTQPDTSEEYNTTYEYSRIIGPATSYPSQYYSWTITNMLKKEYEDNSKNVSVMIKVSVNGGLPNQLDCIYFSSSEHGTSYYRPYVAVVYSLLSTGNTYNISFNQSINLSSQYTNTENYYRTNTFGIDISPVFSKQFYLERLKTQSINLSTSFDRIIIFEKHFNQLVDISSSFIKILMHERNKTQIINLTSVFSKQFDLTKSSSLNIKLLSSFQEFLETSYTFYEKTIDFSIKLSSSFMRMLGGGEGGNITVTQEDLKYCKVLKDFGNYYLCLTNTNRILFVIK